MFIEKNPPDSKTELYLKELVLSIKSESGLSQIYCGYHKISQPLELPIERIGKILTIGFDTNEINQLISDCGYIFLCYIAVPINDDNNLVESPDIDKWDFEEKYISKILPMYYTPVGAFKNEKDALKYKTFKFLLHD